jgi:ubiquinone/menaquinone biosynthesis C-methylase UbiE
MMLETVSCNICGKIDTDLIFEVTENITGRMLTYKVVRCKECNLYYVNPRPKNEYMAQYYPEDSYYSYSFKDPDALKQRIRNYIMEEQGGYQHSGKDNILVKAIGQLIIHLMKSQVLMDVPNIPGGKALDIGCGCGELLLWLKNHGWSEVHGVEISRNAAKLANEHGLNVFCGELQNTHYPDNYFDFISLIHVLEHMHDPMLTLKEISRILKSDGLLVVGVPNFDSYENKVFGKYQSFMEEVPRHLYHFSKRTMTSMLDKNGFAIKNIVGKTFFLPKANINSLKIFCRHASRARVIWALYKVYIQRPLKYFLSPDKDTFGQLFTFYIKKKSHT